MGVKAAGGVRDLDGLKAMVAAGATRVGASAGVKIVQESKGKAVGTRTASRAGTRVPVRVPWERAQHLEHASSTST